MKATMLPQLLQPFINMDMYIFKVLLMKISIYILIIIMLIFIHTVL